MELMNQLQAVEALRAGMRERCEEEASWAEELSEHVWIPPRWRLTLLRQRS